MAPTTDRLRSRLLGGDRPTKERMVEALESRLEDTEEVEYQLASGGSLTHEQDGDTYEKGGGDGGTLLAVTDRKLVFVVDTRTGLETADVPYTDLKDVTADSGILSTELSVRVWGRGTFTFELADGDTAARVAEFATNGSETWQRVVAALQDARQHVSTIETSVEDGEMAQARDARAAARRNLGTARERIDDAQRWFRDPLTERSERVETELARTWMAARYERGQALVAEGTALIDDHDYDAAVEAFERARDHYEAALTIAVEEGFDLASEVQAALSELNDREGTLTARPLELAERARREAQTADDPERAVAAWGEALDHYRDALTAGWGTGVDFDGDDETLRIQIEWVVANLVAERRALAERLERRGDELDEACNPDQARDRYAAAADQVAMARHLASQYRAGDADTLADHLDRLRRKRRTYEA